MARDQFIGFASGYPIEHLALAAGEQGYSSLQDSALETLLVCPRVPVERSLDTFQERILAQRLFDEVEGACLHRGRCQGNSAMAGDEYHRDPPTANIELLLKLDPAYPRHFDVKH